MTTFVLLEGIDGCGKSSVARALEAKAFDVGYRSMEIIRDPGHSIFGEKIRDICADKSVRASPLALTLAFLAARTELAAYLHTTESEFVILDRYFPSTLAYQCVGAGVPTAIVDVHMQQLEELYPNMEIHGFCLMPSLELAIERRASDPSRSGERYKAVDMEFKQRVYGAYQSMCDCGHLERIPVERSDTVEELAERIWENLDRDGVV